MRRFLSRTGSLVALALTTFAVMSAQAQGSILGNPGFESGTLGLLCEVSRETIHHRGDGVVDKTDILGYPKTATQAHTQK